MILVALEEGIPHVYHIESGEELRVVIADFDIEEVDERDPRYVTYKAGESEVRCFMYEAYVESTAHMSKGLLAKVHDQFDVPQEQESI